MPFSRGPPRGERTLAAISIAPSRFSFVAGRSRAVAERRGREARVLGVFLLGHGVGVFTEGRQNDLVRTLGRLFDFCGLSVR